jgi:anti-sigma B factor antagonist
MKRITMDDRLSEEYSLQKGAKYLVLKLADRKIIEDMQIQELGHELSDYVDNNKVNICVDLEKVDLVSSTFLGKLMTVDSKLTMSGRNHIGLRNVRPEIYELFAKTKLNRRFDIDKTSKEEYEESKKKRELESQPEYSI